MENAPHWNLIRDLDPQCYEKFGDLREHIHHGGAASEKTKELLFMAMCCALRFSPGTRGHAEKALAHGATAKEVFQVLEIALLVAGVAAYREAAATVQDLLV